MSNFAPVISHLSKIREVIEIRFTAVKKYTKFVILQLGYVNA